MIRHPLGHSWEGAGFADTLKFGHRPRLVYVIVRFVPMKDEMEAALGDLNSPEHSRQNRAFTELMAATAATVSWSYLIWDDLLGILKTGDNRQRAIAAQVLCNLAKSDPENRMVQDVKALVAVTKDERFVTARHCLQSLWKVGVAGEAQRKKLVAGLVKRFAECSEEKNCTLIRYDILECLRQVYDVVLDEKLRATAEELMATETDLKYRKKYATLWRK